MNAPTPAPPPRVVIGVTGGIAAYKTAELVRLLVKDGWHVDVVMTEAATRFVTPMTFQALSGRTPNASGLFMKGAKSANFYLNFAKNPATWQFGFNYAMFRGGSSVFDQPLRDRDFVGMYVSRNF